MTKATAVYPEVPGELGPDSIYDYSSIPYRLIKPVPVFDTWRGDDLLEMFPVFIVSLRLKESIEDAGLTGASFEPLEVARSETFVDLYADRELPTFFRLIPTGRVGEEDFGISQEQGSHLAVSERALQLLKKFSLKHAELRPEE